MNSDWKDFLESRTTESKGDSQTKLQPPEAGAECVLCDLSHLGLVAVAGADAVQFLQGQFTNDVRQVSDRRSQLSAYCSPKGRMLSNFRIFRREDILYIQLPQELLESTLRRLRMFVLRAKVTLDDASDQLVRLGISGNRAPEILGRVIPSLPDAIDAVSQEGDLTVIRLPGERPRFEVVGPEKSQEGVWRALAGVARPCSRQVWSRLDIEAGIPVVYPETAEAFVPQMANMHLIGGVSFTKGCYTGQEVVARMQYLGKLKRRMYRVQIRTDAPPLPGEPLYAPESESGQGAGRIVDAQPSPDGGFEALAVIEINSAEGGQVRLRDENGPLLVIKKLPYPLEQDEQRQDN